MMLLSDNVDQYAELPATGSKGKYKAERDLIGFDLETNRLIFFGAEAEIEEVKIRSSLLHRYPKITWTSNLQDAHFYIVKKWLIDYITENNKIFSLKSEFLPYVVKKQFSSFQKSPIKAQEEQSNKKDRLKMFDYMKTDQLTRLVNKLSMNKKENEHLSCYCFVQTDGFCFRANNLTIFAEANRQIMGKIMPHYQRERTISLSGKSNQVKIKFIKSMEILKRD